MSRQARLSLSYSRRRPNLMRRQTDRATDARTYPPAGTTRHRGNDETSVARTQGSGGTPGRSRTVGPGVPVHPTFSSLENERVERARAPGANGKRTLLAERMRRGRLAKYKAGLLLPWTHTPYGLRVDPDRPRDPAGVKPDEAKAALALRRSSRPTSSRERASSASPATCERWASRRPGAGRRGAPPPCVAY
jgi:hypothetical protein